MSRIDVVAADKGKFKVLVNFIQFGVELNDAQFANQTASHIKQSHYPHASINLVKIEEKKEVEK